MEMLDQLTAAVANVEVALENLREAANYDRKVRHLKTVDGKFTIALTALTDLANGLRAKKTRLAPVGR